MPRTPTKKPSVKRPIARKRPVRKITTAHRTPKHVTTSPPVSPERPHKPKYIFAVGRRKEAVARVRWMAQEEVSISINDRPIEHYFPTYELQYAVRQPLVATQHDQRGSVTARVKGGGIQGQADAVRLGIARALVKEDPDLRLVLKRAGFLRRDPRVKERKKYGLKRARRAPQWQKR